MPEQNNMPENSNNISAQDASPIVPTTPVTSIPVAPVTLVTPVTPSPVVPSVAAVEQKTFTPTPIASSPVAPPVVATAPSNPTPVIAVASPNQAPVTNLAPKAFVVSPTPVIPATPQEPKKPFYQKKDLFIAGAIGLICALLILPIAENLAIDIFYAYALIILLPLFSVAGMWAASWLAQKLKFIYQVAKFILVGLLNTFVDWGILNLLMFLTSTVSGPLYPVFKGASFLVATSNSYAWNKFWTFKKPADDKEAIEKKTAGKEFLQFFIVSLVGFLLNVGVATLVVNVLGTPIGISEQLWANIGALGGTLTGLAWNFLGYKLIVFKN